MNFLIISDLLFFSKLSPYRQHMRFLDSYQFYRCLFTFWNEVFASLKTVAILAFVGLVLDLSYYIIRGTMNVKFRFVLGSFLFFALVFFFISFCFAAHIAHKGEVLKLYQYKIGYFRTSLSFAKAKYIKSCYEGCGDIKLCIAPFFAISNRTPVRVLMVTFDNLVTLLCATRP